MARLFERPRGRAHRDYQAKSRVERALDGIHLECLARGISWREMVRTARNWGQSDSGALENDVRPACGIAGDPETVRSLHCVHPAIRGNPLSFAHPKNAYFSCARLSATLRRKPLAVLKRGAGTTQVSLQKQWSGRVDWSCNSAWRLTPST